MRRFLRRRLKEDLACVQGQVAALGALSSVSPTRLYLYPREGPSGLEVEDNRGPADGAGCMSQSSVGFEAGPDSISDAGCVETVPTVHQLHPCFCHVGITWRLQQLVQLFLSTPAGRLKANDAGVPVWCRRLRDIRRLYLLFCRRHSGVLDASEPLRTLRALARRLHLGLESSHGSLEVPGQDGLDDVLRLAALLSQTPRRGRHRRKTHQDQLR